MLDFKVFWISKIFNMEEFLNFSDTFLGQIHILARKDLNDAVYKTKREKLEAVIEEIRAAHEKGVLSPQSPGADHPNTFSPA